MSAEVFWALDRMIDSLFCFFIHGFRIQLTTADICKCLLFE